jgi:hypothetical protein
MEIGLKNYLTQRHGERIKNSCRGVKRAGRVRAFYSAKQLRNYLEN